MENEESHLGGGLDTSPNRNDVIVKDKAGRPISLEVIGIFPNELNIASKLEGTTGKPKEPYLLQATP